MAITRSFTAPFEMTDLTEELLLIPNTYGLVNQLGIFREESVTQHMISVESSAATLALIPDRAADDARHYHGQLRRSALEYAAQFHQVCVRCGDAEAGSADWQSGRSL